mmetsp:Transcript_5677/g.14414  ORF Transcript_5677/g.14414 Transcript_5677/m.14414 type:complete len:232 (+) Transcript_5677:203-898(+)
MQREGFRQRRPHALGADVAEAIARQEASDPVSDLALLPRVAGSPKRLPLPTGALRAALRREFVLAGACGRAAGAAPARGRRPALRLRGGLCRIRIALGLRRTHALCGPAGAQLLGLPLLSGGDAAALSGGPAGEQLVALDLLLIGEGALLELDSIVAEWPPRRQSATADRLGPLLVNRAILFVRHTLQYGETTVYLGAPCFRAAGRASCAPMARSSDGVSLHCGVALHYWP